MILIWLKDYRGVLTIRKKWAIIFTNGMVVGSGLWNVEKNAINPYDHISRGFAKTLVNLPLNSLFHDLGGKSI